MSIIRTMTIAIALISGISAASAAPAPQGAAQMFFDQLSRTGS